MSTDRAAQEDSFAFQSEYWNGRFSAALDVEYIGLFADEGISGKAMRNRKGLNLMLEKARNGEIDRIYTKSISRFARNYTELMAVVRELRDMSVPIIFEKENINTLDPKCGLVLSVMASLAEEELLAMSKNQQWAVRKRFANGSVELARLYGYDIVQGALVVNPKTAEIIREIYSLYLQGNGVVKIARIMDESGYKPMMGGEKWAKSSIRDILINEKYIGDSLLQKSIYDLKERRRNLGELPQYYIENSHEAIISKEDFERVQIIMRERSQRFLPNGGNNTCAKYPLSGKIKCGVCGTAYGRKTSAKGKTYECIKWSCRLKDQKNKTACASNDIKDEVFKELLISAYNESLDGRRVQVESANNENQLRILLAEERELKELYVKGYISEKQYRTETERRMEEIRERESAVKTSKDINFDIGKCEKSAVYTQDMADFLMQAIVKDWTVTFRFANGYETTRKYTNGRAGNVNGKLCKNKT